MRWDAVPEAERVRARWEAIQHRGHLPQALIWVGREGIGKTALAWAASQALLCEGSAPPCGQCSACQKVQRLQHPNLYILPPTPAQVSIEEATPRLIEALLKSPFLSLMAYQRLFKGSSRSLSIGVEAIRRLYKALTLTSAEKGWRLVWFWHAETLTRQAANALLKLIEEPPPRTLFLFLTTYLEALPVTVRSRAQVWRIPPLSEATLSHLTGATGIQVSLAEGSLTQLRQLQEPTWSETLEIVRKWLGWCLRPQAAVDPTPWIEALQKGPALPEVLSFALILVRQHAQLSFVQKAYAQHRLLEAIDALEANLQSSLVLSRLTADLVQHWQKPALTWTFYLGA